MSEYYRNRAGPDRAFVVTPYVERNGSVSPEIPDRCPWWSGPEDQACKMSVHHWRERKCGPGFPLAAVRCGAHDGGVFTLYPPGYAPYRRQAVLQLASDGTSIDEDGAQLRVDFDNTLFKAALDAESGVPWPRKAGAANLSSWGTQGRQLELGAELLGLSKDIGARVRQSIAALLSVSVLQLLAGSRGVGYRHVGTAICEVLKVIRSGARRAQRLLHAGYLAGRWGEPVHWDPDRRVLERLPFR